MTEPTISKPVTHVLGIDLGSDTAILALMPVRTVKAEILRNDISNQETPSIVSFLEEQRAFGDLARQMATSHKENTIQGVIRAIHLDYGEEINSGKKGLVEKFEEMTPYFTGTAEEFGANGKKTLVFKVNFLEEELVLRPEQVVAMLLDKFYSFIKNSPSEEYNDDTKVALSFVIPEEVDRNAIFTACKIADLDTEHITFITRNLSPPVVYGTRRKGPELDGKVALFIDIGHSYTSMVAVQFDAQKKMTVLGTSSFPEGSFVFNQAVVDELKAECLAKYSFSVAKKSKGDIRMRSSARKLKEQLSTVPEAVATCENLVEGKDIKFKMTREKLENLAPVVAFLAKLENQLQNLLNVIPGEIAGCELIGGGMRVPIVKATIEKVLDGKCELSFTLDSLAASVIGACYQLVSKFEPQGAIRRPIFEEICTAPIPVGLGDYKLTLSEDELAAAKAVHKKLNGSDIAIVLKHKSRNALESFIFDIKSAANGSRKFSNLIRKEECLEVVKRTEHWLEDHHELSTASAEDYDNHLKNLIEELKPSCKEYLDKTRADEIAREKQLEELSKQAADERAETEQDDHDFRKLSKPDRMKKVVMNKDEGNSLFKDGNIEPASLRYKRALQHCDKFFDLDEEGKKEVHEIKQSLKLNLTMCEMKLGNDEHALKWVEEVLQVDTDNVKGLYRRAVILEKKRDFNKAKKDLLKIKELQQEEDKAVDKLLQRIDIQLKKEKEKQKKMAQKMFS